MDKSGNGYAVIRFLPTPEGEDMFWARCGTMRSKVQQVSGILRTLSPLWVKMILSRIQL